jgi:WD40 repeat protein
MVFPADVHKIAMFGNHLVSCGSDAVVRVSQPSDRETLFELRGHRDVVQAVAISPTGEAIATGSFDGEVCVWETVCGTWVQRFVASPLGPAPAHQQAVGRLSKVALPR